MPAQLAVIIGRAFPDAQGGKMRRLERADRPLIHRVIGDAVDADFAVAPRLRARPFDALIKILRFARRPDVEEPGRSSGAARIDTQTDIAVRHPFLRIDQFPVLIFVARTLQHLGRRFDEPRPIALVAFLERQSLGVRPVTENDRIPAFGDGTEHVGAQHHAVIHRDRRVPIDPHMCRGFRFSSPSWLPSPHASERFECIFYGDCKRAGRLDKLPCGENNGVRYFKIAAVARRDSGRQNWRRRHDNEIAQSRGDASARCPV